MHLKHQVAWAFEKPTATLYHDVIFSQNPCGGLGVNMSTPFPEVTLLPLVLDGFLDVYGKLGSSWDQQGSTFGGVRLLEHNIVVGKFMKCAFLNFSMYVFMLKYVEIQVRFATSDLSPLEKSDVWLWLPVSPLPVFMCVYYMIWKYVSYHLYTFIIYIYDYCIIHIFHILFHVYIYTPYLHIYTFHAWCMIPFFVEAEFWALKLQDLLGDGTFNLWTRSWRTYGSSVETRNHWEQGVKLEGFFTMKLRVFFLGGLDFAGGMIYFKSVWYH